MSKKTKSIPVVSLHTGIAVLKISPDNLYSLEETTHAHRHDGHFFILQLNGKSRHEIDFENYEITSSTLLYIHPNQVHRGLKNENVTAYFLAINNENLHAEYLGLLDEITPAIPLALKAENLQVITEALSLALNIFDRKEDKLFFPSLKNSCNTVVALVISQYLEQSKPLDKLSRFDSITKTFKSALESNFTTLKRPADYANLLNISVPYLNECIKNTTGIAVSLHIIQRVILEAKRMLYHSDKSVKEIAAQLGYNDYAYFSRLFSKNTGISALAFRNKNRD
jgi:AraC family transcriptional activator of pobA